MNFRIPAPINGAVLLLGLVAGAPETATGQGGQDFFELLVEMRIEHGPAREVIALVGESRIMVPLGQFLEMAEIGVQEVQVGRRLIGRYPADERFVFDTDASTVTVGQDRIPIGAGLVVWHREELYVEASLVEWVFLVSVQTNLAELSFTVSESQELPIVLRLARERAAVAAVPPPPEPVAEAQEAVELLVEMRIDRGPSLDAIALADGTRVLVPLHGFLSLAEIGVEEVLVGRRLTGVRYPLGERFVFDTDSSVVTVADRRLNLEPGDALWRDEVLFIETGILESVFSIRMQMNLAELMLVVWETQDLPVVQRFDREKRRTRTRPPEARIGADLYSPPRRPVDGAVFDWTLTSATDDPSRFTAVELGLGAQVLGGSAVLLHEERKSDTVSSRRTTGSWTRVWHTKPWLRQVRIGEVVGTGPRTQLVQGAAITNSPFVRPAAFSLASLDGMFGPGWEVELYRGNRYLGYTTADPTGRYRFDVPIRYGVNPLDIVAYGPRGEVLRRRRTFEIDAARFPAKQFEYGVSGGACPFALCSARANVDLRYGLNEKLTVRGGVDRFWRDTLADVWHPYASVAYQATRGLAFFAEGVGNALVAGRVDYAPSQDFNAGIGHTRFFGNVEQPIVGSASLTDVTQASVLYRPALWDHRTFGRVFLQRSKGDGRTREFARAVVTARLGGARLDVGATHDHVSVEPTFSQTNTTLDARYYHMYGGSLHWLRRTLLYAELSVDPDSGLALAKGGFSRAFGRKFQVDMAVGWTDQVGMTFDLSLTATLHALRAVSTTQVTEQSTDGFLIAEGSVLWEGSGRRIEFSDGRSLGRAGLVGEVFLDVDGNGVAGPDEPRVPDVYVQVGPMATVTDENGRFVVWDVVPFEALLVEIDAQSISNPLWLPVLDRFTFRPDPNAFSVVPVPLVQAGEVSGQVVVGPSERAARFLEVELRNLDTEDIYTVTTFSDGSFYLLGVRPGRYEATVSQDLLDELGLTVEPAPFTVGTAAEAAFVEGITIRLVQR